jgi:hypothetical protein
VRFTEENAEPVRNICSANPRQMGHQRVESAKVVRSRKLSAKLEPW